MISQDYHIDLLQILQSRGDLSTNDVVLLEDFMQIWQVNAFQAIIETRIMSEGRLADIIAEILAVPRVHMLNDDHFDHATLPKIDYKFARVNDCIAVTTPSDKVVLNVVVADPTNRNMMQGLLEKYSVVQIKVSTRSEIQQAINRQYPPHLQFAGV